MKILLLGRNYGSVMNTLNMEFRKQNHDSKAICFDYHMNIHCDNRSLDMVYSSGDKSPLAFRLSTLSGVLRLFREVRRAEVIHVFSDLELHNRFEKKLMHFLFLRIAKHKPKYVTFLGSEVRNPEIESAINPFYLKVRANPGYEYRSVETAENSTAIQKKYASLNFRAIVNPEVVHYLDPEIIEIKHFYNHPGKDEGQNIKEEIPEGIIHFVHAGTASLAKGTKEIGLIVDRLIADGYPVKYTCVQGVPQQKFLEILRSADFYIDQMIWGWYGVAAVQAMSAGIPVISYLGNEQLKHCPDTGITNANLDNLREILIDLLTQRGTYQQLQQNARDAYLRLHNPEIVAGQLLSNYFTA